MRKIAVVSLVCVIFSMVGGRSQAAVIWNGPNLTFSKADLADWTLPENQDRLTDNVWITRASTQGIFNIKQEAFYTHLVSPAGTQWATGALNDWQTLTYTNWEAWAKPPEGRVGVDAVVHLIADDIYLPIKFLSWAVGLEGGGGGFSYVRSTPAPPPIAWAGGDASGPTDWGIAANWNPSAVVPDGQGVVVRFGNEVVANSVIDMISAGRTVGGITFNAALSTTIRSSGGFALTLDNGGNVSTLSVAGFHTIRAPVILNNDAIISGSGMLGLADGISGNHTLTVLGNLNATSIQVNALSLGGMEQHKLSPNPAAWQCCFRSPGAD